MYHRVADVGSDPWGLAVSPAHFKEHLEVLGRDAHPVTMQTLAGLLQGGCLPRRAVAITFDDGYADNLYAAKPLLERYELPATFFITTGAMVQEGEFWWDELDRLLLQPGTLPPQIGLTIGGKRHEWRLRDEVRYDEEAFAQHRAWRTWCSPPTRRHSLYNDLWARLHAQPEAEKEIILTDLRKQVGAERIVRPTHTIVSVDEVRALGEGTLFEIGAHAVTHTTLPSLSVSAQQAEVVGSKTSLEDVLGDRVVSFSYPHGQYAEETVECVRLAGFTNACSTDAGVLRAGAPLFRLPRAMVADWDGEAFRSWLHTWWRSQAQT
jgi:peptidoglycan/xylan/chitin deacetylase (PgdA/CDA1 family)